MAFVLVFLIMAGIPFAVIYIFIFRIPKKTKEAFTVFVSQLGVTGFQTSKQIITPDYTPRTWWYGDMHVGMWVDYQAEKLALRVSRYDVTPQVFDFKNIQDFETIDGPGVVIVQRRAAQELAKNIMIRLVLKNENGGINSVQMSLWNFGTLYGRPDANSKLYQRLLECSRAMRDELNHIMQIKGQKQ